MANLTTFGVGSIPPASSSAPYLPNSYFLINQTYSEPEIDFRSISQHNDSYKVNSSRFKLWGDVVWPLIDFSWSALSKIDVVAKDVFKFPGAEADIIATPVDEREDEIPKEEQRDPDPENLEPDLENLPWDLGTRERSVENGKINGKLDELQSKVDEFDRYISSIQPSGDTSDLFGSEPISNDMLQKFELFTRRLDDSRQFIERQRQSYSPFQEQMNCDKLNALQRTLQHILSDLDKGKDSKFLPYTARNLILDSNERTLSENGISLLAQSPLSSQCYISSRHRTFEMLTQTKVLLERARRVIELWFFRPVSENIERLLEHVRRLKKEVRSGIEEISHRSQNLLKEIEQEKKENILSTIAQIFEKQKSFLCANGSGFFSSIRCCVLKKIGDHPVSWRFVKETLFGERQLFSFSYKIEEDQKSRDPKPCTYDWEESDIWYDGTVEEYEKEFELLLKKQENELQQQQQHVD